MIVIDAKNKILGRIGTFVAKKALLGETIKIINCGDAVLTGDRKKILAEYKRKRDMGTHSTGPFHHRMPERIVKRSIRGMLPYKQEKGLTAFKRIMCYRGVPEELKDTKLTEIPGADVSKVVYAKNIKIKEISKFLGAKI